jgi:formate hydrogenlyase subunit 3/multisubunit Na+/H+ antiporter MnhD subunit
VIRLAPVAGTLFILLVIAAIGLPPFGAFVTRLNVELPLLIQQHSGEALALFAITILTLLYLTRLFGNIFLGKLPHSIEESSGVSAYFSIGVLIIILMMIGLASPTILRLMQLSFSMPIG